MFTWGVPGFRELLIAASAAALVGYLLAWLFDRLFMKWITDDRVAGIALSGALSFVLMMGGATVFLTMNSPFENGPIIIPPFGYAASFIVGVALAAVVRIQVYARQYEWNDDQAYFEPDYNDQSLYDQEVLAWDERNAGRGYIRRHWAGHLSLPLSYWVNSALLSALILAAIGYLTGWMERADYSLRALSVMALLSLVISLLLWVWSSVGVWRSAYWHRRRGGAPGWGVAARIFVFLSALTTVFGSKSLALQAAELGQLALGRDSIGQVASMSVSEDGRSLILRGKIAQGSSLKFREVLDTAPSIREIVLTSEGGRTLEGERMARLIGERRLDTRVDDHCMSACTYLLIAGETRSAPYSAQVGFHQPSFPGLSRSETAGATERMRQVYLKAGVDPTFTARAMFVPAASMWFPDWDELVAANVLTQPEVVIGGSRSERKREAMLAAQSLTGQRLQKELSALAAAINAKGPKQLDQITRLERADASGMTLTYHYTIDATSLDIPRTKRAMASMMKTDFCSDPAVEAAVGDGAQLRFRYGSRRGRALFGFDITDCA